MEFKIILYLFLSITTLSLIVNAQAGFQYFPQSNWAGYLAAHTGNLPYTFNSINGSWIVQVALPTGVTPGYGSQWIGIGGLLGTANLIQIGTRSNYCVLLSCGSYGAYSAFYENASHFSPKPLDITIKPGDKIHASILLVPNTNCTNHSVQCWKLNITDLSENEPSDIIYDNYIPNNASAEWIEESLNQTPLGNAPLSLFGIANFGPDYTEIKNTNYALNGSADSRVIGNFLGFNEQLFGVSNLGTINFALPSNLTSDGTSFKIYGHKIYPLTIFNPTAIPNSISLGQSSIISDSNAMGGSGYYSYQWFEKQIKKTGTSNTFSLPTGCLSGANTTSMKETFLGSCGVSYGLYAFELLVTDNATLNTTTSNPAYVQVSEVPLVPVNTNIFRYVPITIYNNQSVATPVPWQQLVRINSSIYYSEGILNSNLSNVEFFYQNGTVIPSWLEFAYRFYLNDSSYDSTYWLSIAKGIPANSAITVYMGFAPTNQVLINNVNDGVNPYLFSSLNYNYDDGKNVFPFYDNLQGNTFDTSTWKTNYTSGISQTFNALLNLTYVNYYSNAIIAKNNGIFILTSTASLYSTAAYGQGNVLSAWASDTRVPNPDYSSLGFGFYQNTSIAGAFPSVGYYSSLSNSYLYGGSGVNHAASGPCGGSGGCSYSIYNISYVGSNVYWSWYGPASLIQAPYAGGSTTISNNTYIGGPLPIGFWGAQGFGLPEYPELFMIRDRYLPPNNVMPSVTVGNTLPIIYANNYWVTFNGLPNYISFSSANALDQLRLTINDPLITVNGIGTVSYTLCSIPANCLSPGTYDLTVNDLSLPGNQTWILQINAPPNVIATPSNSILDEGQQIYLTANAVNGTGIFDYQWYNYTSGNNLKIANQIGPVMLFNATNSGIFKYYVIANDVGTNTAVSTLSNNVIITVKPALEVNLTPSSAILLPNQKLAVNSVITGGTGNFVYQWYNFSSNFFGTPVANAISNSIVITFNTIGNYSYFLSVTDVGTTTSPKASSISTPETVSVSLPCSTVPNAINTIACIQINIDNTQSNSISSNTQIELQLSASSYEPYEASNMMNVFVYNGISGTPSPCWLEGNASNEMQANSLFSVSDLIYWCKLPDAIPGYTNDSNWYFGFTKTTTKLYGNTIAQLGAAPQLYCGSPYNCPTTKYAKADNGNTIFNFYDNFSGTSLSSKWASDITSGASLTVNNGLIFSSGAVNGASIGSKSSYYYGLNHVLDSLAYLNDTSISNGYMKIFLQTWNGVFDQNEGSTLTGYGAVFLPESTYGWSMQLENGGSDPTSSPIYTTGSYQVESTFASPSNVVSYQNYVQLGYSNGLSLSGTGGVYLSAEGGSTTQSTMAVQWVRLRAAPPNGILPAIELGGFEDTNILLKFGTNPIFYGSTTSITAYCTHAGDTCAVQSTLGTNLCSGKTSCTYTTPILSVGTYTYYANDISMNQNVPGTITVVRSCYGEPTAINTSVCVPISINNMQSSAITSNTQLPLSFPANAYASFEASNIMNVYVYNGISNQAAPCWLEGNTLNEEQTSNLYTSGNILYWCKIPDTIPANTLDNNWYFGLAVNTIDLYGNTIAQLGAAPQLYCASPYNCPTSSYAGADNGNIIFNFYDNFSGTSLSSKWASDITSGASLTINNGASFVSGMANGASIGSNSPYSYPIGNVLDSLAYLYNTGTSDGYMKIFLQTWNGVFDQNEGSPSTGYGTELLPESTYGWSLQLENGGSDPSSSPSYTTGAYGVVSTWASPSTVASYQNYNLLGSSTGLSLSGSGRVYLSAQGGSTTQSKMNLQWVRVRNAPPNDIFPTVTLGSSGEEGAMLVMGSRAPYIGASPFSSPYTMTVLTKCPSAGARIPNVIIPSNIICPSSGTPSNTI